MMSVPPPAGNGTSRRIGRAGQPCPKAVAVAVARDAAATARAARREICMGVSSGGAARRRGRTVGASCTTYNTVSHSGPRCNMRNAREKQTDEAVGDGGGGVVAVTRALSLMESFEVGE